MAVPNTFGTATSAIPLSQLDANFNTPITLGNTAIQLGDTVTTLNNMTLANVTISSGNVTITNVAITTANVSGTANISTLVVVGNETVGGNTTVGGNVTLSGGTANGVAYLNGSKVLTTGGALVFNGTSLAVGGVSTVQGELNVFKTGSASTLYVQSDGGNSTTQGIIRIGGASARSASIQGFREGSSNLHALRFYSYNSADLLSYEIGSGGTGTWYVGGARTMDLTATGLGIGTSSPGGLLQVGVANTSTGSLRAYSSYVIVDAGYQSPNVSGTASTPSLVWAGDDNTGIWHPASDTLAISTAGSERARIDSSGNLGLGVTPSAWGSGQTALQVGAYAALWYNSGFTRLASNVYDNGTNVFYLNTAAASYYQQNAGAHAWFNAPSGTGGVTPDPITFTQAMTLDASGNLLVGATAVGNGGKLYVNGSISLGTSTTGAQSSMAKDTTQLTASVSTSATTIYTDISSGMSSASAGYFIIYGSNNAGAGFMDVVIAKSSGTPVVVSSSTVEGSPAARTYSVSSAALRLTMASGTYNVNLKATVIGYPF